MIKVKNAEKLDFNQKDNEIDGNAVIVNENRSGENFIGFVCDDDKIAIMDGGCNSSLQILEFDYLKIGEEDYGKDYTIIAEIDLSVSIDKIIKEL